MRTEHKRHIITVGHSFEEIGYMTCEVIRKYGSRLLELHIDYDGIYFTTVEYIS